MAGRTTRAVGRRAENKALRFLSARGLHLIERNFNTRHGELDLILLDRETIVFVEVRTRGRTAFSSAVQSVDGKKQRKLMLAASLWLARHPQYSQRTCRFDVLGIDASGQPDWCRDAFRG